MEHHHFELADADTTESYLLDEDYDSIEGDSFIHDGICIDDFSDSLL